jgi:ABC-2 type transport system permease protein
MNETAAQTKTRIVAKLPSDIQQVWTVAKYDILKYLRSRRILGIIAIEVLVLFLISALPALLGNQYPTDTNVFIGRYAGFSSLLVVIGATLFAGDAIVSEFQSRTGYLLFPSPVKRSSLLAGKFIASTGAMFLVLVIYYGVALIAGLGITGSFSTLGVESLLLAMLYSVAALAVGYLVSTIMKGSTESLILTFAMLLFIFPIFSAVLSLSNVDPWFILSFAGNTISDITQVPYPVTTSGGGGVRAALSGTNYVPNVGTSIAVMIAYAVIALILAYYLFQRREMSA